MTAVWVVKRCHRLVTHLLYLPEALIACIHALVPARVCSWDGRPMAVNLCVPCSSWCSSWHGPHIQP